MTIVIVGHNCSIPYNLDSLFTTHVIVKCCSVRATINKHNTINISQYSSNCYVNTTVITGLYPKHALTVPGSGSQLLAMEASVQSSDGSRDINGEHGCTGMFFSIWFSFPLLIPFHQSYMSWKACTMTKFHQIFSGWQPYQINQNFSNQWPIILSVFFIYPHRTRLILCHETINGDHGKGQRRFCLT